MDINIINPLVVSFTDILPQIGFQSVERRSISLVGSTLDYDGVLVHISLVGVLKGAILIGMSLDSAKQFASKMMMGMDVTELDSLAQSAISEMGNMVCANACTQFAKAGISGLDISPPLLLIGKNGQATLPVPQTIAIHFSVDGIDVHVYVGLLQVNS
ncbi:chemotaxis protein CheX [Desulfosporosinus fructosivorans]|uniref:Chemotaxis protein CheX n=1 Tax=Desulfosporosinus fructosivorans TaxID=2018669 RepID=A0A4Z0R6E2_9FIRM|nr:chemotaxis protein CheX [Desulfosporosinus fructosivorans]TGE38410.1 chemotaxis protein CheX [Desulfosporosinus fructosivorans]